MEEKAIVSAVAFSFVGMAREFAKAFYKSKEWQQLREFCLKRDRYMCVECGIRPAKEVHHIIHLTPQNITDNSISLNPNNLKSLCRECHFNEHRGEYGKGRKVQEGFTRVVFDENGMPIEDKENNFG